jgi:hypothetical protein
MAYAEGERTSQALSGTINNGAKYYGTSLAPASVNPNLDKNATIKYLALAAVVLLGGYLIYKKVK